MIVESMCGQGGLRSPVTSTLGDLPVGEDKTFLRSWPVEYLVWKEA